MTRSGSRRMYLGAITLILLVAYYIYDEASIKQQTIDARSRQYEKLKLELKSGSRLSAALADLDNFTINDNGATQLDVLRYVGLEDSDMKFDARGRSEIKVGPTLLVARRFTLSGSLPYAEMMDQLDWLYNTKKVVIEAVKISPGSVGDIVKMDVKGTLYGLDKGEKGR